MEKPCVNFNPFFFSFFPSSSVQGSQEKQLRQASGFTEAVGVVPRPGAGDVTAVEGRHRAPGQDGPRRAQRYKRTISIIGQFIGSALLGKTNKRVSITTFLVAAGTI